MISLCGLLLQYRQSQPHVLSDISVFMNMSEIARFSNHTFPFIPQINVGVVRRLKGVLRIARGRQLPITVPPSADPPCVLAEAVCKQGAYSQGLSSPCYSHIDPSEVQRLLYPSFAEVTMLPGTSDPFTVEKYTKETGRNYNRVTLYLCSEEDFFTGKNVVHGMQ